MPLSQDIDIWGAELPNGQAKEYIGSEAVKNALQLWLAVEKGGYLMNPGEGGPIDNIPFKTMSQQNLMSIKFQLMNALTKDFAPALRVTNLILTPDYQNRLLEIDIYYTILETGIPDNVTIFTNSEYAVNNFTYEEINYTGDNLIEFFTIKKPSIPNSRLVYDTEGNFWKWNKYKFTSNLPLDVDTFTQILIIANGS
jgi:hypothetical protein